MKRQGTKNVTSGEGRNPAIGDLRRSLRRLRILTASLFALTIVLNLTPAAAVIKEKITGEDVVDGSLTGADMQDRSLTGIDVAGGSIEGFNVALDTLVGGHVEDDSLTTLDVQDDSLTTLDVLDGTLNGGDVQDGSLTGGDVAPSSLNGSDVLDNSLTGSDIDESTLSTFSLVRVSSDGSFTQVRGDDVVSVEVSPNPGGYLITFDREVVSCAKNVVAGAQFVTGWARAFTRPETPQLMNVVTWTDQLVRFHMGFELTLWC